MKFLAILCLAAVALAKPQYYDEKNAGTVTTVTERTFTIRGDADKYYGTSGSQGSSYSSSGSQDATYSSEQSSGVNNYAAKQSYSAPSYSFSTVATAVPVAQQQTYQSYQYEKAAAAPAYSQQYYQAADPAYSQQYYQAAAPAYSQQYYQAAAPAYAQQYYQAAAPAYSQAYYQTAAPVAYTAVTAAPAVAYQASYETATAAPAVAFTAVTAAPAVAYQQANYQQASYQQQQATAAPATASYQQAYQGNFASSVGVRGESNYETSYGQSQVSGADTKVFKHVYAFAAPEEPATRATVRVQAPVSKRKHYKLVFIKAPHQQTVLDSDITLPAQEEEKTLIYVLSKNQKLAQPEIRIKQAASSKHAKPEVFFLKYKNEAEAQAIANGAISGQNANVPSDGEIISDGSVSILGQSSGSFGSGSGFDGSYRAAGNSGASNVVYRAGAASGNKASLSAVSAGTVGYVAAPAVVAAPAAPAAGALFANNGAAFGTGYGSNLRASSGSYKAFGGFGSGASSGGSSVFGARSSSFSIQEPASVAIKVTSEPAESLEATTSTPFSQ